MAGNNAAYDFSRFEEKTEEVTEAEVIDFDEHFEAGKPRKTLRHVARALALFILIAVFAGPLIYNEVSLNELNMRIASTQRKLSDAQSEYVQIEMAAEARVTSDEIEKYAVETLGMRLLQPEQIIYVRASNQDVIEVEAETETSIIGEIKALISGIFS